MRSIVKPFRIPYDWPIYPGMDFGPVHTAGLLAALDPKRREAYVFASYLQDPNLRNRLRDELGEQTESKERADMCVEHVKAMILKTKRADFGIPSERRRVRRIRPGWGGNRSEDKWRRDLKAAGLLINPNETDDKNLKIKWLNTSFKVGQIYVFETLIGLNGEIQDYSRELNDEGEVTDKIKEDHKFHRVNALISLGAGLFPGERGETGVRRRSQVKENNTAATAEDLDDE